MLALCAYYEGTVPENQEAFDQYIESVHLPLVASYPRLRALRYLKGVPPRRCRAEILSVVRTVLRQPGRLPGRRKNPRARNRAVEDTKNFTAQFEGEIHHVMYEVKDIPVAGDPA